MRKRNNKYSVAKQNVHDLQQNGDVKVGQYQDNSQHLTNAEFARDFEECCDVEFGRDFENQNYNTEFGEDNMRKNNLEYAREYNRNLNRIK